MKGKLPEWLTRALVTIATAAILSVAGVLWATYENQNRYLTKAEAQQTYTTKEYVNGEFRVVGAELKAVNESLTEQTQAIDNLRSYLMQNKR